jgi:hypothetical protein
VALQYEKCDHSLSFLHLIKIQGLQTDHKALMKDIEDGLHKIHSIARDNKSEEDEKPQQG